MKLKATLFAAVATLAIAPAAHAYEGLYGAIGAGLSYVGADRDFKSTAGPLIFDSDIDYKSGIGVYTSLGYDYGNNWRTELEFSYRNNDARHIPGDGLGFSGWPAATLAGDMSSYALMANLLRDFGAASSGVSPYVGVGVGVARLKAQYVGNNPAAHLGWTTLTVNDDAYQFAYQGIAGLAIELTEGLKLDLSYRYFNTLKTNFSARLNGIGTIVRQDYNSHSLFAGLRWNFGAAGPARVAYKDCWDGSSVPVTAECPPQLVEDRSAALDPIEVIVYFDFDKSNLTPEAQQLIREASARALRNNIQTVVVEGHTDRAGSAAYNQALSQRRANVVRDALVSNGVPGARIEMRAFGEDRPARPTPDGVREPLNRRTEVRISFR